jgi:hypothetical protein
MAIKKQKETKGILCDYWRIFRNDQNTVQNTTCVRLALYPSKEVREKDVMNFLEIQAFMFDGVDYIREELYAKIKESKMELVSEEVEPVEAKEAVLDEEGNILEEAIEAVEGKEAVYKETNWFVDAEDC